MNNSTDSTLSNLIRSSFYGGLRGVAVETLIYPLEVVKIQQQCALNSEKSIQIAKRLFNENGPLSFYKGLSPQLLKTSLKQLWCWPMMIGVPPYLQSNGITDYYQQIFTGLSIVTVDAAITNPLEKAKTLSVLRTPLSFTVLYKEGWKGFKAYWVKRSVSMVTFLCTQKYFRDCERIKKEPLSLLVLTKIGIQVALIVSLLSAPFDFANTLAQAKNTDLKHLFFRQKISKFYIGWPLNAISLIIHNVASVIVIEKLSYH